MSKQTEIDMIDAIGAHFTDEGVTVDAVHAIQVSILGQIDYGQGPETPAPAHYRSAKSDVLARALQGSLPSAADAPDAPRVRTHKVRH